MKNKKNVIHWLIIQHIYYQKAFSLRCLGNRKVALLLVKKKEKIGLKMSRDLKINRQFQWSGSCLSFLPCRCDSRNSSFFSDVLETF